MASGDSAEYAALKSVKKMLDKASDMVQHVHVSGKGARAYALINAALRLMAPYRSPWVDGELRRAHFMLDRLDRLAPAYGYGAAPKSASPYAKRKKNRGWGLISEVPLPRKTRTNRGKTVIQSLLLPTSKYSAKTAKAWAKKHGFKASKVDVTDQYVRIRQREPASVHTIRTIKFGKGIKALTGIPRRANGERERLYKLLLDYHSAAEAREIAYDKRNDIEDIEHYLSVAKREASARRQWEGGDDWKHRDWR